MPRKIGSERDGGPEIGLARDEDERHRRQEACDQQVARRRRAAPVLAEELREHQRHADLGEFRRLKVEGPQRNPAARAAGRRAEEQHVDEQPQQRQVDEMRLVGQRAVVDRQADREGGRANDDRVDLRRRQPPAAGRAVDHRNTDRRQAHDGAEKKPVEVRIQASFEHLSSA